MVVEGLDPSHLALIAAQASSPPTQPHSSLLPQLRRWLIGAAWRPLLAPVLPLAASHPLVLAARQGNLVLALCSYSPANRRRSCWQLDDLIGVALSLSLPRRQVERSLLQEAMNRARGASSWIARVNATNVELLSVLRELGFQPLRQSSLWCPPTGKNPSTTFLNDGDRQTPSASSLSRADPLDLVPIDRRHLQLFRHLEQTSCPAPLRELLDRRQNDLLDQCARGSRLLVDRRRQVAVAALRRLPRQWLLQGSALTELLYHRPWDSRLDASLERLFMALPEAAARGVLRVDDPTVDLRRWLVERDFERVGDEVLMARSVWRRQKRLLALPAARRLEEVLGGLQPGRTPLPTPSTPLPASFRHHVPPLTPLVQ